MNWKSAWSEMRRVISGGTSSTICDVNCIGRKLPLESVKRKSKKSMFWRVFHSICLGNLNSLRKMDVKVPMPVSVESA